MHLALACISNATSNNLTSQYPGKYSSHPYEANAPHAGNQHTSPHIA